MQWHELSLKQIPRKGISSTVTMTLLAQNFWSNYFFYICCHAGGSTKHLEESSPCDASAPKKGKTRVAGKIRIYLWSYR